MTPAPVRFGEVRSVARDPMQDARIVRALGEEFLVWDAFVSGYPRVGLTPLVLAPETHRDAVRAAEAVAKAAHEAGEAALCDEREAARYGLHPEMRALARASWEAGDTRGLCRVDLLFREDGTFQACEVNADCPGGHNETVALPRLARRVGVTGLHDPTIMMDALVDELLTLAGGPGCPRGAIVLTYATAYAEDLQVCAFLERALRARQARVVRAPITALKPRAGDDGSRGLQLRGVDVAVLYRYFPLEYMEGLRTVPAFVSAVRAGTLRTLSSFSHIYAQSKASLVHMCERTSLVPGTYPLQFPETRDLVQNRGEWVVKRALGRVGDEVFVGPLHSKAEWAEVVRDATARAARGETWLAQRFVHQRTVPTPHGPRFVTLGAYVQNGAFTGYFARLTEVSHATHDALVVPVFVDHAAASGVAA